MFIYFSVRSKGQDKCTNNQIALRFKEKLIPFLSACDNYALGNNIEIYIYVEYTFPGWFYTIFDCSQHLYKIFQEEFKTIQQYINILQ